MEIITTSYVNDNKYENCLQIKDNLINCIIDYGNINDLNINGRRYVLTKNICKCFKNKTFEKELIYYKKFIKEEIIKNTIDLFNFDDEFYKKNIKNMSSSELRLIYIFINLLFDENIIILDDVTKDLDSENINKISRILKELKKQNKTIIVITNDVEFIHKISDNVIVIKDNIICEGDKYDVFVNYDLNTIPNVIQFSKKVKEKKDIKIGYRDQITDLMKDIYRYAK